MRTTHPTSVILAALAFALAAAACDDPTGPETAPKTIAKLPRDLSVVEEAVIARTNAFAFDLLREVHAANPNRPNIFLSPFSASMALGMALNGAAGETFDSIRAALRFDGLGEAEINRAYRDLTGLLLSLDPQVELGIANSAWARQGYPVNGEYLEALETWFDAEARELDFDDPAAVDVINGWAADKTKGRIREAIRQISKNDVFFLLNAVYFKGQWTHQFDPEHTSPGPFALSDGTEIQLDRMRGVMPARFALLDDVTVGELPYGGQAFAMTIVVPRTGSLADLVASLDEATWNRWLAAATDREEVYVELPKFELQYEENLKAALQALGMGPAFEPGRADFSRLSPARPFISYVKQNTFLKVDEEGTEAAAVTVVAFGRSGVLPQHQLIVDRPFLVAIRERLSGTILFLGAIGDPRPLNQVT